MIKRVEMINWRAYEHKEIIFSPGINFIMGANGRGKTSILEAIAYALTGESATVSKRDKLLRDPNQLATVRLSFMVDNQEYNVERSQSNKRAEVAKLFKVGARKPLASTQKLVTTKIEEIMEVSADFLQRIIYVSEGNIFRFLRESSGKTLNAQIRQVLGLTQMDEFLKALNEAEKGIKNQISAIQVLLGEFERRGVKKGTDLEWQFHTLDEHREKVLDQLHRIETQIIQLNQEYEDLAYLAQLLNEVLPLLRQDSSLWMRIQNTSTHAVLLELEKQLEEARNTIQQQNVTQARLEGEQVGYQRILEILSPSAEIEPLLCPICGKPMTSDERERIIQEVEGDLRRLDQELQHVQEDYLRVQKELNQLIQRLIMLRELHNNLAHVTFQSLNSEITIAELQQMTQVRHVENLKNDLNHLQKQFDLLKQEIAELEETKANYLITRNQLRNLGYNSPEEASEALVGLEVRSLSLRAASRAAQETLTIQRNVNMEAIYVQVAHIWGTFVGSQPWRVELDRQGMPILENQAGHQFDLSQFSGGEKTALLVVLHTIIAHYFAKSNFLLIDEPLEHLDPVNRRSLLRFLIGIYQQNSFRQAIIATFEESLIRKYMSNEGVNIIHL